MNSNSLIILFLCVVCCVSFASASTIIVSPGSITGPGMAGTVDVTLDSADQGLSGFILSVYPEDPSIVTITGATFPSWASLSEATPGTGAAFTIRALDLNEAIAPGASNVQLVTLNLQGVAGGTTRIMVQATQVDDDQGNAIDATISPGKVTVGGGSSGGTWDITLAQGWNLIGIPMVLASGSDTAEVFRDVPSGGHSVFSYYPVSGWKTITRTEPLTAMNAYWIYSDRALTIPLTTTGRPTSPKALNSGWSIIGIPGTSPVPAAQVLASIADWTYVIGFDPALQQYRQPIIKGGSGQNSDTTPLSPGAGYWIYLSSPGQLNP